MENTVLDVTLQSLILSFCLFTKLYFFQDYVRCGVSSQASKDIVLTGEHFPYLHIDILTSTRTLYYSLILIYNRMAHPC